MKKIFLCVLLVSIAFFAVQQTNAANDVDAIFKIQAYSYNSLFDTYTLEQYGSAVLVAKNILLTNAHVITDDTNKLTLHYEACQTVSEQEAPKCFSTLQVMSYDKDSDLALLWIKSPSENMPSPVKLGTQTLSVRSKINIIGYPANGGETITTTEGTIAWFEDGYYKTDANIDAGNSWGGGFDSQGNFIGIPTFIVDGYSTMGYIIPADTIKEFMEGKIGTIIKSKTSIWFEKFLKRIYDLQTWGKIENTIFSTPKVSDHGLQVVDSIEKTENNLYSYKLVNDNGSLVFLDGLIATNDATVGRYVNESSKVLSDSDFIVKKETKKVGSTMRTKLSFSNEYAVGYNYTQTNGIQKWYAEFWIVADKDNASDLSWLVQFVENIVIKKSSLKPQVLNMPWIKLSSTWGLGIVKSMDEDGLSISIFPDTGKYVMEISAYPGAAWDTLKDITESVVDSYDTFEMDTVQETSKYPLSVSIIRLTDDEGNQTLTIIGLKKYMQKNVFISIAVDLKEKTAKADAIKMVYKILGLEI